MRLHLARQPPGQKAAPETRSVERDTEGHVPVRGPSGFRPELGSGTQHLSFALWDDGAKEGST